MWKWSLVVCSCLYGELSSHAVPEAAIRPSSTHRNMPYVEVDFIYWAVKQEGNNYASTGQAITVPGTVDPSTGSATSSSFQEGHVYSLGTTAEPGFKVALGVDLKHDTLEAVLRYSWLHAHKTDAIVSNNLNTGIIPTFIYAPNNSILSQATCVTSTGADGYVSQAAASWYLRYSDLTWELSKVVPVFCNTAIRPHFGFEASWQSQGFGVTYDVNSISAVHIPIGSNRVSMNQVFWGVGPRIGLDSLWKGHRHGGLFANFGAALLWGPFNVVTHSVDTNAEEGYRDVLIANQQYRATSLSPKIDIAMGLFSDCLLKVSVRSLNVSRQFLL